MSASSHHFHFLIWLLFFVFFIAFLYVTPACRAEQKFCIHVMCLVVTVTFALFHSSTQQQHHHPSFTLVCLQSCRRVVCSLQTNPSMLTLTFYVWVAFLVPKGIKQWLHEHNIPNPRLDLIIDVKNQSIDVQSLLWTRQKTTDWNSNLKWTQWSHLFWTSKLSVNSNVWILRAGKNYTATNRINRSLSFSYSCVEKIGFQQTEQTGTARDDK